MPGAMDAALHVALERLLEHLVHELRCALPDRLVGVYLQGSFALGAADEDSDVDFVVAVGRPLRRDGVRRLQDLHDRIHDLPNPWARRLEGSYFEAELLRTCGRREERTWYLDNGARRLIRSRHCNTAVVRQTLRRHGICLWGPEADTLVDEVPTALLRDEILTTMQGWGHEILSDPCRFAGRWQQGFIVLSFCRMWRDLATGEVGSKQRGAAWAKSQLDRAWWDLIDRAWSTRRDPALAVRMPPDRHDWERTLSLVRIITDECAPWDPDERPQRRPALTEQHQRPRHGSMSLR